MTGLSNGARTDRVLVSILATVRWLELPEQKTLSGRQGESVA
jgi:hypothetical protein